MAIKCNYNKGNIFAPDAYFKIVRIVLLSSDEEKIIDNDNGFSNLIFETQHKSMAHILIYSDQIARRRNAAPIGQMGIEFDYSPSSSNNPWDEAYKALKNTETIQKGIHSDC